jgi:hypothetical protein
MFRPLLCVAIVACACANNRVEPNGPEAAWTGPRFRGMCDASAAVILDDARVLVADDEDNRVRIYAREGGDPQQVIDPSSFLELEPKSPEVDLEAATRSGDVIYWVSSHGRSSSGKPRPNRLRFFATRVATDASGAVQLTPIGRPMPALLEALVAEPKLAPFDLARSAEKAPKAEGGLSIEGLALAADGEGVLIGFRNPLPEGKALTVILRNPDGVVQGEPPRFDDPRLIDLGGRGIRSIDRAGDRYLIGAGAFDDRRDAALYWWGGGDDPPVWIAQDLGTFMPEAIVVDASGSLLLFSDDGTTRVGGKECKRADPSRRSFRGMVLSPSRREP